MEKRVLFAVTADILCCSVAKVKEFCMGNESAVDIVTPQELAAQIREYEGRSGRTSRL